MGTSDSLSPPAYDQHSTASAQSISSEEAPPHAPPSYQPAAFTIGSKKLGSPLVTIPELQLHLDLLGAFHTLKSVVLNGNDYRFPSFVSKLEPEQRWGWFVGLAVERPVLSPGEIR
jgi:hypothetical protein